MNYGAVVRLLVEFLSLMVPELGKMDLRFCLDSLITAITVGSLSSG